MVNENAIINSLNAIAITVNSLSKSHLELSDVINSMCKASNINAKRLDPEIPHANQIVNSKYSIAAINAAHSNVMKKLGLSDDEVINRDEMQHVKDLSDKLLSVSSDLASSCSSSHEVARVLDRFIAKANDDNSKINNVIDKVSNGLLKIDGISDAVNDLSNKYSRHLDVVSSVMLHVEQCLDKIDSMSPELFEKVNDLDSFLSDLNNRIKTMDSSTLIKTQKISNDIIKATNDIRSYMKPMADRLLALEHKMSGVACNDVYIPNLDAETPRARNRRI